MRNLEYDEEISPGVYRLRRFRDRAVDDTELQEGQRFVRETDPDKPLIHRVREVTEDNPALPGDVVIYMRHTEDTRRELMPAPTQHRFSWFAIALLILVVLFGLGVIGWVPVKGAK